MHVHRVLALVVVCARLPCPSCFKPSEAAKHFAELHSFSEELFFFLGRIFRK
jgi:hypothetical protein